MSKVWLHVTELPAATGNRSMGADKGTLAVTASAENVEIMLISDEDKITVNLDALSWRALVEYVAILVARQQAGAPPQGPIKRDARESRTL